MSDAQGLAYIREQYSVPAYRFRRITVDGRPAVIIGARDAYLRVRFGDQSVVNAHPTWRVDYDPEDVPGE